LALAGQAVSALALRLGFIALFAGSTLLMIRLAARHYGPRAGLLAGLALNVTGYFGLIAGTFALPDGPLVFFWLLTLDRLAIAFESPARLRPWFWVGLAWGGALLSKYHAVFLPAGAVLYALLDPAARRWLRQPGPYLAILIGSLMFTPVLWWNATHDWASFAFQGSRALGAFRFQFQSLSAAVGGQAAYLLPWMWAVAVVVALKRAARWSRGSSAVDRFLLCEAALPIVFFTAVACFRPVFPHWSLVGFLALLPLVGDTWARRREADPARMSRRLLALAALPIAIAAIVVVQSRTGFLQRGGRGTLGLIAPASDPTLDLFGWDQVARGLEARRLVGRPNTFLFTGNWYHSGQLAFATKRKSPVLCYHAHDARNFAFWSQSSQWAGHDGILVALDDRSIEPGCFDRWFVRIEPIGQFPIVRAGVPVHKVRLFRCIHQLEPFPFDDSVQSMRTRRMIADRLQAARLRR
jgi:4-amino-4-deoxy-L-arabinose transferase-like glycosyltransferase